MQISAASLFIHSVATDATVKPFPQDTLRTSFVIRPGTGRKPYESVESKIASDRRETEDVIDKAVDVKNEESLNGENFVATEVMLLPLLFDDVCVLDLEKTLRAVLAAAATASAAVDDWRETTPECAAEAEPLIGDSASDAIWLDPVDDVELIYASFLYSGTIVGEADLRISSSFSCCKRLASAFDKEWLGKFRVCLVEPSC